mgnify:CR=1 FL=1
MGGAPPPQGRDEAAGESRPRLQDLLVLVVQRDVVQRERGVTLDFHVRGGPREGDERHPGTLFTSLPASSEEAPNHNQGTISHPSLPFPSPMLSTNSTATERKG